MKTIRKKAGPVAAQGWVRLERLDGWHGLFFLLGIGCALAAGFVPWNKVRPASGPAAHLALPKAAAEPPWGQIEYTTLHLERPNYSLGSTNLTVPPVRWAFENVNASQLLKLFTTIGLTPEQTTALTNQARWTPIPTGWQVMPPPDTVVSLPAPARRRIYGALRKSPRNPLHFHPFQMRAERFDDWLAESGLSERQQKLIRKLAYQRDNTILLSDFELIEARSTLEERKLFAKAISQTQSLMMRIHVTPQSDVAALARYWGRAGRMKAMQPFLDSLTRVPEGTSISVSFFFPEFARMRLYTYPDPETDPTALRQDCFWTAMNFMNEKPDDRFLDATTIPSLVKRDFEPVTGERMFGDLIVLLENGQSATHMCVYVADEVVFTKNGVDPLEPWLLMKIQDMLPRYTNGHPLQIMTMRRKEAGKGDA